MKTNLFELHLAAAGFQRTNLPLSRPIVVHGVPGCGKSTLLIQLLADPNVRVYTCGVPTGACLAHPGISDQLPSSPPPADQFVILDEYQLAAEQQLDTFHAVLGDPFQGPLSRRAHFTKSYSHRVPRPVAELLTAFDFTIQSDVEGQVEAVRVHSGNEAAFLTPTCLHLGAISRDLAHSHGICSKAPREVQGREFEEVTVIFHSSELANRVDLFVAFTRARRRLVLLSDLTWDELRSATRSK
ncbi:TGB1 [Rehmannia allexivirus]